MATSTKIKNLGIWEQVETTDPKVTKRVAARGGFTAICAQSQIKKATELFGPIGSGWGHKDEQIFAIGDKIIYQAVLWYDFNGTKGEFPISSSIPASQDDTVKKVSTDAITKGLSRLGFNSDVFEGKFDDNKYVKQRMAESDPVATNAETKRNEGIAAARAKEADKLNRGEVNTMVFEAEQKAHDNAQERKNSRMKHLGYDNLTSPDIDKMREYYKHLQEKIKEKEKETANAVS